jgi:ribose 5-phosphate isomerase B
VGDKIVIASDHGGLETKSALVTALKKAGVEVEDLGTSTGDSVDYPDFAALVASAIIQGKADRGILVCGTGIGISIAANKFPGIRAAVIHDEFTAQMSKQHNNANIVALGGRIMEPEQACQLVDIWRTTKYEGGRHQLRLDKITRLEEDIQSGRILKK